MRELGAYRRLCLFLALSVVSRNVRYWGRADLRGTFKSAQNLIENGKITVGWFGQTREGIALAMRMPRGQMARMNHIPDCAALSPRAPLALPPPERGRIGGGRGPPELRVGSNAQPAARDPHPDLPPFRGKEIICSRNMEPELSGPPTLARRASEGSSPPKRGARRWKRNPARAVEASLGDPGLRRAFTSRAARSSSP